MQLTVRLKLLPDPDSRERLLALMKTFNECCDWISLEAHIAQTFRRFDLQRLVYRRAREVYELRGATTSLAVAKAAAALTKSKGRIRFRPLGAIEFHSHDFRVVGNAARFATSGGHITVPIVGRKQDVERVASGHGQVKLLANNSGMFLLVPITVDEPEPSAVDAIGVDLGVTNIATRSDGQRYSGAELRGVRYRRRRLRAKLQSKGTRSAKRRLKRLRRREARFARDVNHCISKRIVADAERTKSAVVLEELRHIRTRIRASRQQRAVLHSWSFGQLRNFITYKAALAGVPVILVDPRNSSRECSQCGHVDKRNRPDQATFKCRLCGYAAHADFNAAVVIRDRGRAQLSAPHATILHGLVASPSLDS